MNLTNDGQDDQKPNFVFLSLMYRKIRYNWKTEKRQDPLPAAEGLDIKTDYHSVADVTAIP